MGCEVRKIPAVREILFLTSAFIELDFSGFPTYQEVAVLGVRRNCCSIVRAASFAECSGLLLAKGSGGDSQKQER
jgi:hypothetical protein